LFCEKIHTVVKLLKFNVGNPGDKMKNQKVLVKVEISLQDNGREITDYIVPTFISKPFSNNALHINCK
jgi:hypothetical protein